MDNPSNSRADAAYDRALAAFHEKSYDVARRWAVEALAHNRQHSGARALMGRLDTVRAAASPFQGPAPGSEVISTDPTVLISRASSSESISDGIEPTVMVRRDEMGRRPSDTDPRVAFPPSLPRSGSRSTSEPTIIAQPRAKSTSSSRVKSSFSVGAALQSLGERLHRGSNDRSRSSSSTRRGSSNGMTLSTPAARGALLAIGTVLIGALLVGGLFFIIRWMWPASQVLTISPPTGGTIKAPGIECGTGGNDCSAKFTSSETVELTPVPDKGFVFSGYTGSCAPAGRVLMSESRTCGATFGPLGPSSGPPTFRLTINKPTGGTIVGNGNIYCGTNGSVCTADIPSGVPVTLRGEADDGFGLDQFTGDCPSTGEMVMTAAKTCSAAFIRNAPINRPVDPPSPPVKRAEAPKTGPAPPRDGGGIPPGPSPTKRGAPADPGGVLPPGPVGPVPGPDKPPPPPMSADDHAKQEIAQLVTNYCAALQSLKPATIRTLFHLDNERELKDKFKEYKSLKCDVASEPKFDRLDSGPAGAAQVKFGMKQVVKMASGGAPQTIETNVTMVVSRKDFQSPWLIDRLTHEPK